MQESDYRVRDKYETPSSRDSTKTSQIIFMYEKGISRTQKARELHVSNATVRKRLEERGYAIKPFRREKRSKYHVFDGIRYRVIKACEGFALIDKRSPRWSTDKLYIEEIIDTSRKVDLMVQKAKKLEWEYLQGKQNQ